MCKNKENIELLFFKQATKIILLIFSAYLWTSFTSIYLVNEWGDGNKSNNWPTMKIAQMISVPLLAFILFFFIKSIYFIKSNLWLFIFSLIYFVIFSLIFLSVAPGCFTEDTFYTFHMVKNGWWEGWYSPIHPILMTSLIQIIPWQFYGPSIFLTLLWAFVYIFFNFILIKFKVPKIIYFFPPLIIFLPAQFASSIIIVRDSYFTAIFIIFILYIFYLASVKKNITVLNFIILSIIGSFLSFYRSDAILSVFIGYSFIIFIYLYRINRYILNIKIFFAIAFPCILIYLISSLPSLLLNGSPERGNTWGNRAELEYKLTLIENPLGYIARNHGVITNEQRTNIERVFKINDLITYWCPQNICVFFGGHWNKDSSKEERDIAFKTAFAIFIQNPKLFIFSKFETLKTVGDKNTQTTCSVELLEKRGYLKLFKNNILSNMGTDAINLIKNTETDNGILGGKKIWWNVYIPVAFLLVLLVFFKIALGSSIASLILLTRSIIVFLTAPAGFTVYYNTLFIGAPFIFLLFLCEVIKNRNEKLIL